MLKNAGKRTAMNNQAPLTAQALIEVKDLSFKRGERVIYDQVNLKNLTKVKLRALWDHRVQVKPLYYVWWRSIDA